MLYRVVGEVVAPSRRSDITRIKANNLWYPTHFLTGFLRSWEKTSFCNMKNVFFSVIWTHVSLNQWNPRSSCVKQRMKSNIKGYPTKATSPLKSPTYERTKKFKCSVHSCGSLIVITPLVVSTLYNGLWSDSRSSYFTQLCKYVRHE